jgi:ubiquinone/menaquinone biosynthesis C-methylase UbiE
VPAQNVLKSADLAWSAVGSHKVSILNQNSSPSERKGFPEDFWSKKEIKDTFLDEQREYIWNQDYFRNVLIPLFRLRSNSAVLDVGCGLGFICEKLAEFVPQGRIIGVDLDPKLIEAAKERSIKRNHLNTDYRVGNAYELPLKEDSVDFSICQTLLMHLEEPLKAISEMRRVTRKGGIVVAIEPDFSSLSYFDTAYEEVGFSLEDRVKQRRWNTILNEGKRKLGRGDNEIGPKVPVLFLRSGLKVVDVRLIDRAFWLVPPYEGRELELKHLMIPPEVMIEQLDMQKEFLAGGGLESEWNEFLAKAKEVYDVSKRQIGEKTFLNTTLQAATITVAEKT